ncbi:MAG: SAM-dependent chlorinase/fluorinase [Crocinitomicaceae bacterium]|nr:SAM-dependent chlorinase/fluorinase [Crocinitomicaceae bacterium]
MQFITLTTDMGLRDYYVATLKSAILQQCNDPIHLLDVTHYIRPFDVAEAAFVLGQAHKNFPDGTIHIVGVDAEPEFNFGNSEGLFPSVMVLDNQYFFSTDNGFFGVLERYGTVSGFYRIEEALSSPKGYTFPSKTLLATYACRLANNEKIKDFAVPHQQYKKAFVPVPTIEEFLIKGSIVYFDSFGNAITNIDKTLFNQIGNDAPFIIKFREGESYKIDEISTSYNQVPHGEKLALFNESGLLEISINKGANATTGGAQKLFGLALNDIIRVEFQPRGSKESLVELF